MSTQNIVLFLCLAVGCLSTLAVKAQAPQWPVYQVQRISGPIRVDGKLDDTAWKKAPLVGEFREHRGRFQEYDDDNYLYFAFRSVDDNIWSTMKQRDEHRWEGEVVEVFLQADPNQPSYIELEINPLGAMLVSICWAHENRCHTRVGTVKNCGGQCKWMGQSTEKLVTVNGPAKWLCQWKTL